MDVAIIGQVIAAVIVALLGWKGGEVAIFRYRHRNDVEGPASVLVSLCEERHRAVDQHMLELVKATENLSNEIRKVVELQQNFLSLEGPLNRIKEEILEEVEEEVGKAISVHEQIHHKSI